MKRLPLVGIVGVLLVMPAAVRAQETQQSQVTPVTVIAQAQERTGSTSTTSTGSARSGVVVAPETRRLLGYSIVLLLGETQGGTTTGEGLSAPARKALADIKDFLPYKSYRTLDTQWLAGAESSPNDRSDTGRLRGPDNQEYDFQLWSLGGRPHTRAFRLLPVAPVTSLPNPLLNSVLLNTTFDIYVGETVVVGTSRLQGDKALVVLVTAVPR